MGLETQVGNCKIGDEAYVFFTLRTPIWKYSSSTETSFYSQRTLAFYRSLFNFHRCHR